MKILVLNGSPKREASDTLHMTRAFVAGMNWHIAKPIKVDALMSALKRILKG